jgi:predicted neuraminidase
MEETALAAAISDDEGGTWKFQRKLENQADGSYSYPSVIQSKDGKIHVTYSFHLPGDRKSIKHITFKEKWILDILLD